MKEFTIELFKGMAASIGLFFITNINSILGGTLTALSIAYLIWKWRIEYKKNKRENEGKN